MNCEHGDNTGLNDACGECLNEALAKEFEAGRRSGRALAYQGILNRIADRTGLFFMQHCDDQAQELRVLYSSIEKESKEDR